MSDPVTVTAEWRKADVTGGRFFAISAAAGGKTANVHFLWDGENVHDIEHALAAILRVLVS